MGLSKVDSSCIWKQSKRWGWKGRLLSLSPLVAVLFSLPAVSDVKKDKCQSAKSPVPIKNYPCLRNFLKVFLQFIRKRTNQRSHSMTYLKILNLAWSKIHQISALERKLRLTHTSRNTLMFSCFEKEEKSNKEIFCEVSLAARVMLFTPN